MPRQLQEESLVETTALPQRRRISRFLSTFQVVDIVPALALAAGGGLWIAVHASQGRGFTHTVFQCLALAENVVALALARRKPLGSLLGILLVYLLVDLEPTTLPAVLFALAMVAALGDRRSIVAAGIAVCTAMLAMPQLHGGPITAASALWHLVGAFVAVGAGLSVRAGRRWASDPAAPSRSTASGRGANADG